MPKALMIDPKTQRAGGELTFKPVPLNQYDKTVKEELVNYSKDDLFRILTEVEPKEVMDPDAPKNCKLESYEATPSYQQ